MPINVSGIPVSNEAEAEKLMVYHLACAARLFEATSDDRGLAANKLLKAFDEPTAQASSAFIDVLCSYYEGLSAAEEG